MDSLINNIITTDILNDVSFSARKIAYEFLKNELTLPSIAGVGYDYYHMTTGITNGMLPHSSFVDTYIKGGMLYLIAYLILMCGAVINAMRAYLQTNDNNYKCALAGFIGLAIGYIPLLATLSVDMYRLPWATWGCLLGLTFIKGNAHADYHNRYPYS